MRMALSPGALIIIKLLKFTAYLALAFLNLKVMGLPRKKNFSGRWDVLIDKATKCLNRLLEIAPRKKRNYILDQVK